MFNHIRIKIIRKIFIQKLMKMMINIKLMNVKKLEKKIVQENDRLNEEYMSHVTNYQALIDIMKSGHLMSKNPQIKTNEQVRAMVTAKANAEMHQIVFSRGLIRLKYSLSSGAEKRPPVIFLVDSLTILTQYLRD